MHSIKLNVLIVEDNLVNQKVLKKQLQKFGWNISVAGDGQEALEWLKRSVYWQGEEPGENDDSGSQDTETKHDLDIILMDIEMPIMDGLACARFIRDYESQGLLAKPPPRSRRLSLSPILSREGFDFDGHHERPNKQSLRLPILAVSANARMEQVEQALAAG
jgi:CheY-like chemotaxis protein